MAEEKVKKQENKKQPEKKEQPKKEVQNKTQKDKSKNDEVAKNIKKEATDTVNKVKDTIKNVDIKQDSIETKGFITDMFKNPLGQIKNILDKENPKFFTYALILLAIWTVSVTLTECFTIGNANYLNFFNGVLALVKEAVAPLLTVIIMSVIVYVMNKQNKKSLTTLITVTVATRASRIMVSVISLLTIISRDVYKIINPLNSLAFVISTVVSFFAVKTLFKKEKDSEAIKQFVKIEVVYYVNKRICDKIPNI